MFLFSVFLYRLCKLAVTDAHSIMGVQWNNLILFLFEILLVGIFSGIIRTLRLVRHEQPLT